MSLPPPSPNSSPFDLPPPAGRADDRPPSRWGFVAWLIAALAAVAAAVAILVFAGRKDDDTTTSSSTTTPAATTLEPATTALPEPTSTSAAPTATEAPTTAAASTVPAITDAPTTSTVVPNTLPPTTAPPAPPPTVSRIVIAANDGTHLVTANGDAVFDPQAAQVSFIASDGSLIFQQRSGLDAGGDSKLTHIRRTINGQHAIIVAADSGTFVRLHDVSEGDGNDILVLYSILRGSTPDTTREDLFLLDLLGGNTRRLGQISGWESGAGQLRLGNDVVVGEQTAEISASMLAIDLNGNPVDLATPLQLPATSDIDACADCPRHFTIDRSGTRLAWLEGQTVVWAPRAADAAPSRFPVPADLLAGHVTGIQLLDSSVLINHVGDDGAPLSALLVDLTTGGVLQLSTPGQATLA